MFALLALITLWVVVSGGGGRNSGANGGNGKNPASSITPGPSGSGPAISQKPGGRDESSDGSTSGSGSGSDAGSGSGAGTGSGGSAAGSTGSGSGSGDIDDGANGSGSAGGSGGGGGGSSGTGTTLPAGTTLPNCTAGVVTLSLRSVQNAYSPDQTPTFRLTVTNSSGSDCKVDLGPKAAVLTITHAGSDDDYWSSADCPKGAASLLYRVPAGDSITYVLKWDRKPSAPECATPPAGVAGAGTYLVEAKAPGFAKAQTSFVLDND
ncbi:hypothetical protein SAMN04487983_103420 [Streptomyces sp. yr375]|nr:hypothetical protein SAMN04487983_103420 [Streptomyces sp. yr375]